MNRRELMSLVSGIVIGLLAGILILASSVDLRDSLFGTVVNDRTKQEISSEEAKPSVNYYLVELSDAQAWLAEQNPALVEDDEFTKAMDVVGKLPTSTDFRQDLRAAQPQIEMILPQMVAAVVGAESVEVLDEAAVGGVSACLGWNGNDPYAIEAPVMYLYLTIPADRNVAVSEDWQKLDKPKSNDLYWQLLACYPDTEAANK